ncbi:MAG: hypothetical protein R8P61_28285 [Bacteroidia bacterium]|nr:hypothetical protein [Bacteroidia bacterium]
MRILYSLGIIAIVIIALNFAYTRFIQDEDSSSNGKAVVQNVADKGGRTITLRYLNKAENRYIHEPILIPFAQDKEITLDFRKINMYTIHFANSDASKSNSEKIGRYAEILSGDALVTSKYHGNKVLCKQGCTLYGKSVSFFRSQHDVVKVRVAYWRKSDNFIPNTKHNVWINCNSKSCEESTTIRSREPRSFDFTFPSNSRKKYEHNIVFPKYFRKVKVTGVKGTLKVYCCSRIHTLSPGQSAWIRNSTGSLILKLASDDPQATLSIDVAKVQ